MQIPAKYERNTKITRLLVQIDELWGEISKLEPNKILLKFQTRKSILKSSLYSARIEGSKFDKTTLDRFGSVPESQSKLEITNLVKAVSSVGSGSWYGDISLADIKNLHSIVLSGISSDAGSLRSEPSAIFNVAGVAVYLCPPPGELVKLISEMLRFINEDDIYPSPVRVALIHYTFEKIHPFLDGNGRVGRILIHLLMKKYGYSFHGLFAYEEYLDKHRDDYYSLLGAETSDVTNFVEFILEAFIYGLQQGIGLLSQSLPLSKASLLLPRRQEILALIFDHPLTTFDFIQRRFMAVPGRTLRYDLKYLSDHEFIVKLGSTKGVLYSPKSDRN